MLERKNGISAPSVAPILIKFFLSKFVIFSFNSSSAVAALELPPPRPAPAGIFFVKENFILPDFLDLFKISFVAFVIKFSELGIFLDKLL